MYVCMYVCAYACGMALVCVSIYIYIYIYLIRRACIRRYNLSVALLGLANSPEDKMNMGESVVSRDAYTADHSGASYMLSVIPLVKSLSPTAAGTLGGALLTIQGEGFSSNTSAVSVEVAGTPCAVVSSSVGKIVCELKPFVPAASSTQNDQLLGERGISMRIWYEKGQSSNWDQVCERNGWPAPNISETRTAFYEAPVNILSSTRASEGPVGVFEGYFRAPVASKYTFILASDDSSELWLGRNPASLTRRAHKEHHSEPRDWHMRWERWWSRYDPHDAMRHDKLRSVGPLWLDKGESIYTRGMYKSEQWGDHFSLAVKMHNSPVGRKHNPHAVDDKQVCAYVQSSKCV
jgi:hypothetical protein